MLTVAKKKINAPCTRNLKLITRSVKCLQTPQNPQSVALSVKAATHLANQIAKLRIRVHVAAV